MHVSSRLRRVLPWIVGSLLLAIILWRVPLGDTLDAIRSARLEVFLPMIVAACIAWFLLDSAAFSFLFTRFNTPLDGSRARELRGLTYLLTPIHWNVGRVAVIARMHATHRVPILEATSSVAFLQTLDALLLSMLAWIGLARLPASPLLDALAPWVGGFSILLASYLVILRSSFIRWRPIARLRASTFHRTHRSVSARDVGILIALRIAYYAVFLAVYAFGTSAFGIELPFARVVASVPIIQAIGALPISPAGVGTQQAAMLYLFSGYGTDAAIVGFGLSFPFGSILIRSLIGWPYLHRWTYPRTVLSARAGVKPK